MRHRIMYTYVVQGKRWLRIMDFKEGRILSVTVDELAEGLVYRELLSDLSDFMQNIKAGYYDYTPPVRKK